MLVFWKGRRQGVYCVLRVRGYLADRAGLSGITSVRADTERKARWNGNLSVGMRVLCCVCVVVAAAAAAVLLQCFNTVPLVSFSELVQVP